MSRWLTQLSKKKTQKTRQLWERKFSVVEEGLDEEQVIAFVDDLIAHRDASQKATPDSVRSIIERAVTDAEQIAASIKMRAQKEVDDEAVRIIDKAKEEADEIRRQAETVTKKKTEDVLAALNAKTRLIEEEAKQKVESLLLQASQEVEKEVRDEYKEAHSRLLSSLMRGTGEMLPSDEAPTPLQSEQKPDPASKETEANLAAKEEAKKKAEEAKTPKMPASKREGKLSRLLTMKLGKKTEATKEAEEPRQQAESEATPATPDEVKKKAEEAKTQTIPASKREGKLSRLLTMKLGKKTEATKEVKEPSQQAKPDAKMTAPDEAKNKVEKSKQTGETRPTIEQKAKSAAAEGAVEKKAEKPVQPKIEATVPKPVESIAKRPPEQPLPEEKSGKQEPVGVPQKLDREAIYNGEMELAIAVPVDPAAVSKLYNYLQSTPDMKILYTRGSWDRGTTITVALDKPLPLIGMISKISGLTIAPGLPQKENLAKGTSSSLLGAKRKELTKIYLILKAE